MLLVKAHDRLVDDTTMSVIVYDGMVRFTTLSVTVCDAIVASVGHGLGWDHVMRQSRSAMVFGSPLHTSPIVCDRVIGSVGHGL